MILDGPAVAVVLQERGWEELVGRRGTEPAVGVGAPTLVETALVLTVRLGRNASPLLARFIQESQVTVVAFTEEHWRTATDAYTRFGQGRIPFILRRTLLLAAIQYAIPGPRDATTEEEPIDSAGGIRLAVGNGDLERARFLAESRLSAIGHLYQRLARTYLAASA